MVVVSAICLNEYICEVFISVRSTSIMTCNRISDLLQSNKAASCKLTSLKLSSPGIKFPSVKLN